MGSGVKGSLVGLGVMIFCSAGGVAQVPDSAPRAQVLLRRDIAAAIPQLQKTISLQLEGASLDEALQTVAHRAELPITYNDAILPRERKVWLTATEIRTDEALEEILRDSGLQLLPLASGQVVVVKARAQGGTVSGRVTDAKSSKAIPNVSVSLEGTRWRATTGADGAYRLVDVTAGTYMLTASRIGYAEQSRSVTVVAGQEVTVDLAMQVAASELEQVIVTGTVVPTERKAIPTPISVVTADDIQKQNLQRVDQIFRGQVPGAIAWDQGTNDYYSTIIARGASALASSGTAPNLKTFIDGVEVADAGYIATVDPNSIERIEITRGPQASTLYGAGALGGVMQIFTKKGGFGLLRPEVTGKVSVGGIGGFDGQSTALRTDNTVSVLGGSEKTSYNLGGSYRNTGPWAPTYKSRDWSFSAGGQATQGPFTLSSSVRYADKTYDLPWDTRFASYSYYSKPFFQTDRYRQQTYGATATLQATSTWQHTLTLGYDQTYLLQDQTQPRLTTPADTFLYTGTFHESKTSLLYHTDLIVGLGSALTSVMTAGVNYDAFDMISSSTFGATRTTGSLDGSTTVYNTPWSNTGYFGQVQLNIADQLFLTGGLRGEQNDNFGLGFGTAWSPRLGIAYLVARGPATVKIRASYGESIRVPTPGDRDAAVTPYSVTLANPALSPERQRGGDGGVEIYLRGASLGVTYYNQRATDLIDRVAVPPPPGDTLPTYQYQNISRVKNEGWEFEGHLPLGPVQVAGTYSIAHSTVLGLPPGYGGAYRLADQVLGVPRTSGGATVTYAPVPQTTLTASMTYIGHWTNLDVLALYGFLFGGQPYRGSIRAYWLEYPTVTKFAMGVRQVLTKDVTAFVRAENVGNNLRYEQFSSYIPTPRTVLVGADVRY